MPGIVFKYVRKMRSKCSVLTFIPETFMERAAALERVAYEMRHSDPSYNTKIKWGWGDLILERKPRGSREQYKFVHITDIPPVDQPATPTTSQRLAGGTERRGPGHRRHPTSPLTTRSAGRTAGQRRRQRQDQCLLLPPGRTLGALFPA